MGFGDDRHAADVDGEAGDLDTHQPTPATRRLRYIRYRKNGAPITAVRIPSGSSEFQQFVPAMQRVIAQTPAGRSGRPIVRIPNFFGMPIRDGDHVEAVARALHPEAFP